MSQKCTICFSKIVPRLYKLKSGEKHFRRLMCCSKTVAHSYTDHQIREFGIDVEFYKEYSEKLRDSREEKRAHEDNH